MEIPTRESPLESESLSAVDLLKSQHREIDDLFDALERADSARLKEKLFESLAGKLTMHAKIEETIFYPAVKDVAEELVLEAHEEHDNVKAMLKKLERFDGGDETFDAKVKVLKELVGHHVREEEGELFPKCEAAMTADDLEDLGLQMQAKVDGLDGAH